MSRHQFETPVSTERTIRDRIIDPRGVFLRFLQIVIRFSVILLGTLLFGGGIIWLFNWLHPPGGIVVDTPLKLILFFLHLPVVLLLLVVCAIGVTLLIMWRISRPLAIRAYLQAVRKEEERYARVYVHLSALENIYKTPVKYGQNTNGKDLLEVVEQHQDRHLLFLGLPGAGKTTALHACQHHALHKQEKNKKIPLFIPMNSYSAFLDTITSIPEKTLLPYLHYESSLSESKVKGIHHLARYLEQLLQQGRLLLLCDGLNELNSAYLETVCAELMGLMRANQNRLVMTCREFDYHEQEVFQRLVGEECAEGVTIPPLGLDDIRKFVTSYIEAKDGEVQWNITVEYVMRRIEGTPLLYHCTNPLMLSILMQTLNEEDAQIGGQINTRGRLLGIFVLRLVERELARPKWVARRLPEDFRDNVLMFLSEIAWTARRVNRRNGIQLSNPRSISGGVRRTPSRRELINDLMNWLAEPDPRREEPLLTYEDLGLEQLHDSYRPEQVAQFLEFAQNAELITLRSRQGITLSTKAARGRMV